MKTVYCAVASAAQDGKSSASFMNAMKKQMQFTTSAARYFLKSKDASTKYENLRKNLTVETLRSVWDLLEDPMTSFFATTFGFAPAMESMKVNFGIRIPVKSDLIFNQVNQQQQRLYRSRSLSAAAFKKEQKGGEDDDDDSSSGQGHNVVLPASDGGETYLIRCRFLNPTDSPVHPDLIDKTYTRNNFTTKEKDEKDRKKNEDIATKFFKKANDRNLKGKTDAYASANLDDNAPDKLIIHIHGGGWVSQSPDQHIAYVSEWANMAKSPVISIDYSLSPETEFPISPNECFAVYKWILEPENRVQLGLSKKPIKIVVCGDSAGGNLTCCVTLKVNNLLFFFFLPFFNHNF